MNIRIVGAGSLGLLFAAKLSGHPEANVRLVARRAAQAKQISSGGLDLLEDDRRVPTVLRCASFEENDEEREPWDWIFLMVKQTHMTDPLIRYITKFMTEHTKLLCFQNGVGHVERLTAAGLPLERIYLAVTTEAARRDGDRLVVHTGRGTTLIGGAQGNEDAEQLGRLERLLQECGMSAEIVRNIDAVVWRKLLINSVINPLTAIMNVRNGELLSSSYCLKLMEALYDEACAVLEEEGLPVSGPLWEVLLDVCRKTAANVSSMLQDVRAGNETEIDWINGSIIRLAAKHNRKAPSHEAVYNLVKWLEHQTRQA